MVLDFIGTTVLTAVIIVNVGALISTMELPPRQRLALAGIVGLWIGLQAALASAGAYATENPYIGLGVVTPLIAAAATLRWSPQLRAAMLGIPTALLVALNVSRVFGGFFLLLAASDRLGGPFPQSAGWGDILTGLLAIPLAMALTRGSRRYLGAWNLFGAADLVVAVTLGVISAQGSPVQLIDAGIGSAAVSYLPWSLIPTVLVPFYLILHAVIFMQQREQVASQLRLAREVAR